MNPVNNNGSNMYNENNNNGGSIYRGNNNNGSGYFNGNNNVINGMGNPMNGYNPTPNGNSIYGSNPNGNQKQQYNPNGSFVDGRFVNDYDMGRAPKKQTGPRYDAEATAKVGVVILVMAAIMFLLGIGFGKTVGGYKKDCTEITEGVIVDVVSGNKKGYHTRRTRYTPYVEYTVKSKTYTHKVTNPGTRNLFHVGDKMMVHYDPADPNNSYVDRESKGLNGASVMMNILGSLTLLCGLYLLIFANKKKQDEYKRYGV